MTIYDLRNTMKVEYYHKHSNGGAISYYRNHKLDILTLGNDELLKELIAIGSLEDGENYNQYVLSQWDALNIAIRFELARETEKDLQKSDVFESIAKLIKPNK
jgi:hypothetical protein